MRFVMAFGALLCSCATVEPGHLGLLFNSYSGGLHHEILPPGVHYVGAFGHIEDFDITYSTRKEEVLTTSSEGLALKLKVAVIYRPIASEIYALDSEIVGSTESGVPYYDEVIAPEFRSAARGVFARHSYMELLRRNEEIENEIEADLRRRVTGKHVEVASVTMEAVEYAPEIGKAVQDKLVAEQEATRQKTLLEQDAARQKLEMQFQEEHARMASEAALRQKQQETQLAKEEAELDKVREEAEAEKGLIQARAASEELKVKAAAEAEETRLRAQADADKTKLLSEAEAEHAKALAEAHAAENRALTPLAVMLHGYDALRALGEQNAHIMLGDWSRIPNFLFPANLQTLKASAVEGR